MIRVSIALCILGSMGCVDGTDTDREVRIRERANRELSDRIVFDGEDRIGGAIPVATSDIAPSSFRLPLEIRTGTPFQIDILHAPRVPRELLFELDSSGEYHRAPLQAGEGGTFTAPATLGPALGVRVQRRHSVQLALTDDDGSVGRSVLVPLNVVETTDGLTPGASATVLVGHDDPVESIDVSSADVLVTGGTNGAVRFWLDGVPFAPIPAHEGAVHELRLVSDDGAVVSAGADGFVRVHGTDDGALLWEREAHMEVARALDVYEPADRVVSGGWDQRVVGLDLQSGDVTFEVDVGDRVNDIAFREDGSRFAVALGRLTLPGALVVLDSAGTELARESLPQDATAVSYLANGDVAVAFGRGFIRVYTPDLTGFADREGAPVDTVEDIHEARELLMALSLNGRITVWDSSGQRIMRERFEEETFSFHVTESTAGFGTTQGTAWLFDLDLVNVP